ncbi:MAG: TonB-dependent receptor [Betaproteobacteria bacterium]|nr:TonB-dependent receptor [Betaproteobacteria bacterium]
MRKTLHTTTPAWLTLALLPAVVSMASNAQTTEPANRLDNVVVTATRTAQSLDQTLAQATIITRDEIDLAGVATLTELLQRKAGIEIRATGGPGQPSSVFIRGGNSAHTLVLVDGLRVSSSSSGSTAFENIPLDLIERIEIVKGPLSGLYGSDAIGGVVQIFTRNSSKPRLTAAVGAGSESTIGVNTGFSVREGKTALTLDAGYQRTRAQSATNPAAGSFTFNADRDPYRNTRGLITLTQELWQGERVGFTAWQSRGETDFDAGPGAVASNKQTLSGYQLTSENNFGSEWKSRIILGQTIDDSRVKSSFPGNFKTQQNQVSWFNEFKTWAGSMSAGVEWREEKLASDTQYDAKKRETTSIFAGYIERIGPGQLEFTARRDEEDQFGRRNTGSLSYGYTLSPQLTVYARAGHAFRAPSFNDLYYPGFSNPLLKPEQSDQAEAGIKWRSKNTRVDIAHFENRIDDLIVFDTATFLPQNLARARIKGWELSADTSFVGIKIKAALTVQRPEDRDTGKQLRSRAKQFGSLGVAKSWGAWDVGGDIVASGRRYDGNNESAATRMRGYALLNATVRYRIDKTWSVELSGQNLTDTKYELAQGYNTPKRSLFLNVRAVAF